MPHFRRLTFLLTPGLAIALCHCSSAFTAVPPPGEVADASDGGSMNPPVIIVVDMDAGDSTTGSDEAAVDGRTEGASEASRCTAPLSLDCDGVCVDPTVPSHCGSCSNVCAGPEAGEGHATCTNGACAVSCDVESSTSLDCNGSCVDPTDVAHCGSCTNACAGPSSAKNGQAVCFSPPSGGAPACGIKCAAGYHSCNGDCLLDTDTPSVTGDPCILTEAFGVFVAPTGNDGSGDGSRAHPFATIGHAMDKAATGGTRRVYACATAGSFGAENLVVETSRDGVNVFGGLDCSAPTNIWTYGASKKATLAPAAPGYALRIKGSVSGNTFEDLAFVSREGGNAGDSSIAVFVTTAQNVVFRRSQFNAGLGNDGAPGLLKPALPPTAPVGNSATSDPATNISTPAPQTVNSSCPTSIGGAGGCADTPLKDGSSGQPGPPNGSISNGCISAGVGQNGGDSGPGSGADRWATFTGVGWTPMPGQDGVSGLPGQGGGGGAGPIPPMAIANPEFCGGAGGAGGCGGAGGGGGGGGGSSMAVLMYESAVDFETCTLHTSNAGQGGAGQPGQPGQAGGAAGAAAPGPSCAAAGAGGRGGAGGAGGGGAGGISVGIVWQGRSTMAPMIDGNSVPVALSLPYAWTFGTPGAGGNAGTPLEGRAGVSQLVWQYVP